MASFEVVNYSLRPSKSIQRQLVFEGLRSLIGELELRDLVYVGLGSIWFVDFVIAHKALGVEKMVSIEKDAIGFARARFNAPYATVDVRNGASSVVLPDLLEEPGLASLPWVVWLDYDGGFDEGLGDDVRLLIEKAPSGTSVLVTFNAAERAYGRRPDERVDRLRELFEGVFPAEVTKAACKGGRMQGTLADLSLDFMRSVGVAAGRPERFIDSFRLVYRDGPPMVTVGGTLTPPESVGRVRTVTQSDEWRCKPLEPIVAPHLTMREALALQSKLPRSAPLTRGVVESLGFDLEKDQIEAFQTYYREYPAFAQVVL